MKSRNATKKTKGRKSPPHSAILKIIEARGSVAQFARDLSKVSKQKVTWGRVNNWKIRGAVSKNMVLHVHRLTGAPLRKLLS